METLNGSLKKPNYALHSRKTSTPVRFKYSILIRLQVVQGDNSKDYTQGLKKNLWIKLFKKYISVNFYKSPLENVRIWAWVQSMWDMITIIHSSESAQKIALKNVRVKIIKLLDKTSFNQWLMHLYITFIMSYINQFHLPFNRVLSNQIDSQILLVSFVLNKNLSICACLQFLNACIVWLNQTPGCLRKTRRSFTETAECLVERDKCLQQ